jgi:hypothetical protein
LNAVLLNQLCGIQQHIHTFDDSTTPQDIWLATELLVRALELPQNQTHERPKLGYLMLFNLLGATSAC